jgi:hypothetical protein
MLPPSMQPLALHTASPVIVPSFEALSVVPRVPGVCLHHVCIIQFPTPSRHLEFSENKIIYTEKNVLLVRAWKGSQF